MRTIYNIALWLLLMAGANSVSYAASKGDALTERVSAWLADYPMTCKTPLESNRLDNVTVDRDNHIVRIFVNATFGVQRFTRDDVDRIYAQLRELLPKEQRNYRIMLFTKRILIDDLVPMGRGTKNAAQRLWHDVAHSGNAWVTPIDRQYPVGEGLEGRHISLWASHGRYYSQSDHKWMWQRPSLFCTTEDLFSQTFVIPLLIPMLENAGAIVFSPRERDWQRHEAVVDNDAPNKQGRYIETVGQGHWRSAGTGFAHIKETYTNFDNPFTDGTARMVDAAPKRAKASTATWIPNIPVDGKYAVYVSYVTLPTSVPDATYTVCHRGVQTRFRVNQQMGSATWVYLGTFNFAANDPDRNYVRLSNHSNYRGHVTADGVRFGGGMGNIARGEASNLATSGLPRCLEGARYYAQWAGMAPSVYAGKGGNSDYAEDINVRSHMTNYLAGGSAYVPQDSGLHVPIEMCLALHTDAGFTSDSSAIGSLAIYTTEQNDGVLKAGLSRLACRDLADGILTQLYADIRANYGKWTRRQLWDRNYSETREPEMPSAIIEMLSHQNFSDMRLAHDPTFKFTVARAIYKAVLRYLHAVHGDDNAIVQPLPVTAPAALVEGKHIRLTWQSVNDPLEPTARPTEYVVYHAVDAGDFDNGTLTDRTHLRLTDIKPGVLHRFRICAVNAGGQSLPSQEVCAYIAPSRGSHVLVVDAFDRLAAPEVVDNDSAMGFDMSLDRGVPLASMPGFCGRQRFFRPNNPQREGYGALGYSGSEYEGILIAGNTFDWTTLHATDIIKAMEGSVSISSCTATAFARNDFDSRPYPLLDLVGGLQRADGYSLRQAKLFTEPLRQALRGFTRGGGSLFVSGAYVANDMREDDERLFTRQVLRYEYAGTMNADSISAIEGMGQAARLFTSPNEVRYSVTTTDCLAPAPTTATTATPDAFCAMTYTPSSQSAAVAYKGTTYRAMTLGFPIESVNDVATRQQLWRAILPFLLSH